MRALVIGGNRYFGRRLVENLVKRNHNVTVMNRGNHPIPEGATLLPCDRTSFEQVAEMTKGLEWDVIFDHVCMSHNDALVTGEFLAPKTGRYVMISAMSVYPQKANLTEKDFDPVKYTFSKTADPTVEYGEAKRQAEATLTRSLPNTSMALVRIPIVLGPDDYTRRLFWHIERVQKGEGIYFPNLDAKMGYIHAQDVAANVEKLGFSDFTGPINLASPETLSMRELLSEIESATGKTAHLTTSEKDQSPFGVPQDWWMSTQKAQSLGFKCRPLLEWLKPLIRQMAH